MTTHRPVPLSRAWRKRLPSIPGLGSRKKNLSGALQEVQRQGTTDETGYLFFRMDLDSAGPKAPRSHFPHT